jgi:DNA-binding MarR family transcriptional regulator
MDKKEVIAEIVELQRKFNKTIVPYAIDAWRELNVPLAQLKSLLIITSKKETNSRTLAQDLKVTPGDVTGIIERLVEQGLVARKPSLTDRRVIWLQATDKGHELLANLIENQTRHMIHILEYMSLDDLRCLSQGLAGVFQAVEEHQKEFLLN